MPTRLSRASRWRCSLHIACTALTVLLMLLAIGFGAAAMGRRFRTYSIATLLVHLVFGAWAAAEGPRLARGGPTPWIGVTERINIGVFLLWVAVLAVALMRKAPATRRVTGASGSWLLG